MVVEPSVSFEDGELFSSEEAHHAKRASKRTKRRRSPQTSSSPVASSLSGESSNETEHNTGEEDNDEQRDSDPNSTRYKSRLKKDQHRLEKIERALTKAREENNKDNERKCKKYQMKYTKKVNDLKSKLDECEKKRDQLSGEKEKKQQQKQPVQAPQMIKLPYPVLNDKRDKNTIYRTLETKLNEVMRKESVNRGNIATLHKQLRFCALSERRSVQAQLEKLNQLDTNYESQREKLIKQLDYIRLSLNLDKIRGRVSLTGGYTDYDIQMMAKINQEIGEMVNYMKHENRVYLKSQKAAIERETTPPPSTSAAVVIAESPTKLIKSSYESLCKALVAVLAHTAACAHATAAINAYSQSYYSYMQEKHQKTADWNEMPRPPPIPLKKELENASFTFEKYKSKISSFFIYSKRLDSLTKRLTAHTSELNGLNKLVPDYDGDSDEESSSENEKQVANKKEQKTVVKLVEPASLPSIPERLVIVESDQDEDKEDDSWQTDLNYTCDLEIVITSEEKALTTLGRKYILPSLKASYFPLKASLDYSSVFAEVYHRSNAIASEKSQGAITVMGSSGSIAISEEPKSSLTHILYSS